MSIESLAPRQEAPELSLVFTTTPEPASSAELQPPGLDPETPLPSLQERRLRVARELDTRIGDLEQDIRQLSDSLTQSRLGTAGNLRELQQHSTSLTSEILRVGARLAQQGRAQEEQTRQLDRRLGHRLHDLEGTLTALSTDLRKQTKGQDELQTRHDTLSRLYEHLDRIVNRQGRNLDILAAEFQQRVELLRVSIEGLQSTFHAQQESLLSLTIEHDQLCLLTQQLQAQLADIDSRLEAHLVVTRQRFKSFAIWLGALALLTVTLFGYFQLHPVAAPAEVSHQLSMLTAGLSQQEALATTQEAQVRLHEDRIAEVAAALQDERRENRRLRQVTRQTNARLVDIRKQLAELHSRTAPVKKAEAETPAETPPLAAAQQAPGSDAILLPPALPGSRPSF